MAKEIVIDGKRCRVYSFGLHHLSFSPNRIWVADTGDFVAYYDVGGGHHGSLTIRCGSAGPYLKEVGEEYRLDAMVMSLFGPERPVMANQLHHKDENLMNCDYRNLEWVRQNAPFDSQL